MPADPTPPLPERLPGLIRDLERASFLLGQKDTVERRAGELDAEERLVSAISGALERAAERALAEATRNAHAVEPESQTVGQLNTSVRVLREEVYQQRLRAQAAESDLARVEKERDEARFLLGVERECHRKAADRADLIQAEAGRWKERADAAESESARLREEIRRLALDYARLAGSNMRYEVKRPSRLLDPRPQPWQAREIACIYWPARLAQKLWRILRADCRAALSSSPETPGNKG